MERIPHKDKFYQKDLLEELRKAILRSPLDTTDIISVIRNFINKMGYYANDKDINNLVIETRKGASFEDFKNELEKIAKSN